MKNCLRISELLLACLLILTVAGCARPDTGFEGGERLTPERIVEIRESLRADETTAFTQDTDADGNGIFYWVKNGSVIHADRNCRYIADSENVSAGSMDDAKGQGIDKKCSACAGQDGE